MGFEVPLFFLDGESLVLLILALMVEFVMGCPDLFDVVTHLDQVILPLLDLLVQSFDLLSHLPHGLLFDFDSICQCSIHSVLLQPRLYQDIDQLL